MSLRFIAIGVGDRGNVYGDIVRAYHQDDARYVAVAEPIPERRRAFAALHNIPPIINTPVGRMRWLSPNLRTP